MTPIYKKLQHCLQSIRQKTDFQPKVALVLGSGLGEYENLRNLLYFQSGQLQVKSGKYLNFTCSFLKKRR